MASLRTFSKNAHLWLRAHEHQLGCTAGAPGHTLMLSRQPVRQGKRCAEHDVVGDPGVPQIGGIGNEAPPPGIAVKLA